ncbi:hypothetical protein pb186bvf_021029 [Paramecium bursaria]
MSDYGIKNMTEDIKDGLNTLNNENPLFSSYFHFQNIDDLLKQHYNIHDVSICKICISFERAEDVDSYISNNCSRDQYTLQQMV